MQKIVQNIWKMAKQSSTVVQSEAGKSSRTVPNEEEEEEFGPQLITKLEVCTHF